MRLGIDLGTSNSSAAFFYNQTEEVINIEVSTAQEPYDSIVRSCALISNDPRGIESVSIGAAAEQAYKKKADAIFIPSFKPYLNETHLRQVTIKKSYVMTGYNHHAQEPIWTMMQEKEFIGAKFSKNELMKGSDKFFAEILRKSKDALENMGIASKECNGYLIGVPLNAKMHYKFRLLEAIKDSSPFSDSYKSVLKKTTFIPEPVAVSFCFHEELDSRDKKVLIFDFGGGTLDLALLEYETIQHYVLPTKLLGLSCLDKAGNYINSVLKDYIIKQHPGYEKKYSKLDPLMKFFEEQRIEQIKINLSTKNSVHEKLPSGLELTISRKDFSLALNELFKEIEECIHKCFRDAKIKSYDEIDKIIMSGGSSLIPALQDRIKELFGEAKVIHPNPANKESIEIALTGVSRGLAKYDYFIEMSKLQINKYALWDQKTGEFITLLERNQSEGTKEYDPSLEGFSGASLCLFYNLIKEEPLIALVNIPYQENAKWKIKIKQNNVSGVFPSFEIYTANGLNVLNFKLSDVSEKEAMNMITNCEWKLRKGAIASWIIPCIPIETGNAIKVNNQNIRYEVASEYAASTTCLYHSNCLNGERPEMCVGKNCDDGVITYTKTGIREISSGKNLRVTNNWDLSKFVLGLIKGNATIQATFNSYDIQISSVEE